MLDAALVGARRRLRGPGGDRGARWPGCFRGPGRLIEWDEAVHHGGVALWLERVGEGGGAVRQRHYLHLDEDGLVERHWIYTARPRTAPAADPVPEAAEELFASLGESPSARRSPRAAGRATASTGSSSPTDAR